jgi:glycosyltransferase involved in cell wall biosynthesis
VTALRVAMTTRFPYVDTDAYSGLVQVARNLCAAIGAISEIDLHVVAASNHVNEVERKQRPGFSVTYLPNPKLPYYATIATLPALSVRREIARIAPDIVHCQAVPEAAIGSVLSGKPLITTIHGIYRDETASARTLREKAAVAVPVLAESWYVPRLRNVFVCSSYVDRFLAERNPRARRFPISNPIDPVFFSRKVSDRAPAPHSIVLVGAVVYRKGHDLLIGAAERLVHDFSDLVVTIAGPEVEPTYAAKVKRAITDRGLSKVVRWLGPIDQSTLVEELSRHNVLCLPSRGDTLPMVIAQGWAVGNVCVASDAGGIPDMITDERNGFLFPAGDAEALYRTLGRVLEIPKAGLDDMAARNREYAERTFHPDSVAAHTITAYRAVVGS